MRTYSDEVLNAKFPRGPHLAPRETDVHYW
jgi:hypothetical protein